jgi:PAS domain S-box-containing protein
MVSGMTIIKFLSIILVAFGVVFFSLSLPHSKMIRDDVLNSHTLKKKWRAVVNFTLFFLSGYILFGIVLFFNLKFPLELVTAAVFFGGAFFVLFIVHISRDTIRDRQNMERSLRDSELCFQTIFNTVYEAIVILDLKKDIIMGINDRSCAMFGASREECLMNGAETLFRKAWTSLRGDWRIKAETGEPWIFEMEMTAGGGKSFWVEGNARVAYISGEDRLLVSMRDITRKKRSEDRLSRLNRCFLGFTFDHNENIRQLTILCGEMMGAACALYNKLDSGRLCTTAHWNAPFDFRMVDQADGHICTDVIKRGGDRLFHVADLPGSAYAESDPNVMLYKLKTYIGMPVKCDDAYVGSLCVVFQNDYQPDPEDEKFFGILTSAIGVEEERRRAEEALNSAYKELEQRVNERTSELASANEQLLIDIAERKKAEEALWKSESILRKVFEAIPDMLAVIDKDLRILHSNWQGGYEYVSEEIRNSNPHCYDAYYPEHGKPCENCHALQVFRTGREVKTEKFNPRVGLVEVRAFPVFDDSGEVAMVAEYIRNITEQRRVEEDLRRAHKLESLGVLAGGIAHDFNNLLTGILGNISLAKVMSDPKLKIYSRLDEAEKAGWRARDLTQQLMTFSKGGAPIKKTASIEQIVTDSASFVLRGSNVKCQFRIADGIWPVEVDEGQMSQVINNLIINADQAMPDGGVIDVGIENLSMDGEDEISGREGRYVKISIVDHGVGIPEENLHRIFDPYFTTKQKGSGLGLATVYSIIKNHDALIRVESKPSVGTTFEILIPASTSGLSEGIETMDGHSAGAGRILFMDDEDMIREVAEGILTHLGYFPVLCRDGNEAIDLYLRAVEEKKPFDAVIMDLTIPGGMGGRETMKKLLEINRDVIGIVSSGYSNDPILANYSEYGFKGIVDKPYSMEKLGRVLHELLANGVSQRC